ncbi:MAG: hypothetical protein A2289_19310 [Deltaproteobacteria bacterium RIFOXYA12_FULL_58_15]|nr:MAG: hypothetical protein A2289_19310 [Deltaproteobacteria bacterium RIFOXYA12_FULL_58_15]
MTTTIDEGYQRFIFGNRWTVLSSLTKELKKRVRWLTSHALATANATAIQDFQAQDLPGAGQVHP